MSNNIQLINQQEVLTDHSCYTNPTLNINELPAELILKF